MMQQFLIGLSLLGLIGLIIFVAYIIYIAFYKKDSSEQFNTVPTTTDLSNNSILYTNQNGDISTWSLSSLIENVNVNNNTTIKGLKDSSDRYFTDIVRLLLNVQTLIEKPVLFLKGPDTELKVRKDNDLIILDGNDIGISGTIANNIEFNSRNQLLKILLGGIYRIELNCSVRFNYKPKVYLSIFRRRGSDRKQLNVQLINSQYDHVLYGSVKAFEFLHEDDEIYFEIKSDNQDHDMYVTDISIMVERISTQLAIQPVSS